MNKPGEQTFVPDRWVARLCPIREADIYAFGDVSHACEIIVAQWLASIRPAIGTPILDQV